MRTCTTPNGHELKVTNGTLSINGKYACDIKHLIDAEKHPPTEEHVGRAKGKKVLYWCNFPKLTICNPDVAQMIREEIAEEAAREKAKREDIEKAEREAIDACPEGKEAARVTNTYDGNTFVEAVSDGAKSVVYGDPETVGTTLICYLDPAVFANERRRIDAARKADEDYNRKVDEAFAEAKRTGKPAKIRAWTTDRCHNGHDAECSFDNAVLWALPDGSTRTTYTCCY